jgi:murein DD-endopeptidase MepM/ murein hydrolase activator NlpD
MGIFSAAKRAFGLTKKNTRPVFNPRNLKVTRGEVNKGSFGRLNQAERNRMQLRIKSNTNVTVKAKDARIKYAECGCDELKKVIDAEKAGVFSRIGAVGSLGLKALTMSSKSNIESAKIREADKKVAKAAQDALQKYAALKSSLVKAGIETQEEANKAIQVYGQKVREKQEAVDEAKKASNAAKVGYKRNLNSAKYRGYQKIRTNNKAESAKNKVAKATAEVRVASQSAQKLQEEAQKKAEAVQLLTSGGVNNVTRKQQLYNKLPKNRSNNSKLFTNFTNQNLQNWLRLNSSNTNLSKAAKRALNLRSEDPGTPKSTNPFA